MIIGITGGSGSGKTTLLKLLEEQGILKVEYDFDKETTAEKQKEVVDKVDEVIKNSLVNYKLNRLSYVDRAIIRMATAEMMMGTAVAVVINEALEIVKIYSDQGDGNAVRFINKVLDNVSKNIER